MKPETKPSLFSRISLWLRRLRDRAFSFWKSVPSLLSKLAAPFKEFAELISPKDDTGKKGPSTPKEPPIIPNVVPPPPRDNEPEKCRYPHTSWWKTALEVVAVITVIAYTTVAFLQWRALLKSNQIARETFNANSRPYVGMSGGSITHYTQGKDGEFITSPKPRTDTVALSYDIEIKNFGPVPGTNFVDHQKIFLNGKEQLNFESAPEHKPSILFPGQIVHFNGYVRGSEYRAIMVGATIWVIDVTVEYEGPSGHYKYCERHQYEPPVNGFGGRGVCPE